MRRQPPLSLLCLMASLLLLPASAHAAVCDASTTGLAFGSYRTFAAQPLDSAATITVRCDVLVAYTIALSPGGGSFADRQMTGPVQVLHYNLYLDVLRLIVWGDGTAATSVATGLSLLGQHTVYGRVAARQNISPGSYGDNIVITVTY